MKSSVGAVMMMDILQDFEGDPDCAANKAMDIPMTKLKGSSFERASKTLEEFFHIKKKIFADKLLGDAVAPQESNKNSKDQVIAR